MKAVEHYRLENGVIRYYPGGVPEQAPKAKTPKAEGAKEPKK